MCIKSTVSKKTAQHRPLLSFMSACLLSSLSFSAMAANVSMQDQDPSSDEFINAFMGGSRPVISNTSSAPEGGMKFRGISLKKSTPKPQPVNQPTQQDEQAFNQQVTANKVASACMASKQSVAVNINFSPNSTNITDTALIRNIAKAMNSSQLSDCYFIIEGHTDASGNDYYNLWLSQQRAGEVKRYLSQYNVFEDRLVVVGKGEDELLNRNNPGSKQNRRVVFKVINYKE